MDAIAPTLRIATCRTTHNQLCGASAASFGKSPQNGALDVETVASNSLIPTDRKWAIRFTADGLVTIVLGMKDYGRGWFSSYFASLVAARLGVPFAQIRVYYSATFPAVLQAPVPSPVHPRRDQIGPMPGAIADVLDDLCGEAIEKGRLALAAMAGVAAGDARFDQETKRFVVRSGGQNRDTLEMAAAIRTGSSASDEPAAERCLANSHCAAGQIEVHSAA